MRVVIPNLAGHTLTPRFDLTTDDNTGITGVFVDNVVIKSLHLGCGTCTPTAVAAGPARPFSVELAGANPFHGDTQLRYSIATKSAVRVRADAILAMK